MVSGDYAEVKEYKLVVKAEEGVESLDVVGSHIETGIQWQWDAGSIDSTSQSWLFGTSSELRHNSEYLDQNTTSNINRMVAWVCCSLYSPNGVPIN